MEEQITSQNSLRCFYDFFLDLLAILVIFVNFLFDFSVIFQ